MNALLFAGLLYVNKNIRNNAISELIDTFGNIEFYSQIMNFSKYSDYYNNEIGNNIIREWILFKNPVSLEHFYEKKLQTIEIENRFRINGLRSINIDPGCITLNNIQLLTTKNYSHRIYLGEGIFSELTFMFTKNDIKYLDWTYPDYKSNVAEEFFLRARKYLKDNKYY